MQTSRSLKRKKSAIHNFIEAILKEYICCKKVIKNCFYKILIMPPEDQERFPLSNKCWTCSKLFDVGYNKVRQHCRITGKYRGSAH